MFIIIPKRLVQAALLLGVLCLGAKSISFPPLIGPYNTSMVMTELVDRRRWDPYAPTYQPRALMISLFYPVSRAACSPHQSPYMDPITAAYEDDEYAYAGILPGALESITLEICQRHSKSNLYSGHRERGQRLPIYPLVLFSPGMGNTRLLYNGMAQQLASTGYIVVSVDHPYDADIVTYPDNTTVLAANITGDAETTDDVYVRVEDISFVLDQLSLPSVISKLIPELTCGIDASRVGIFGHSLGGATAAQVLLSDSRFAGGINLDGTFFGSVIDRGFDKPFLIFAHEGKNQTTDTTWATLWSNLKGFRREFTLSRSTHGTFTDLAQLADLIDLRTKYPQQVGELLGNILGERSSQIIGTYVSSFFDFVLKGKKSALLDGPSKDFPEVTLGAT